MTRGQKFYITNDTVIMKALNDEGELDPELISVDRFVSISITKDAEPAKLLYSVKMVKTQILS
ncbi:MAG: hypothetical protein ACOX15_09360 [Tepidanaerobacteraceae bacterium]